MSELVRPGPQPDEVRLEERIRRISALLETRFDYLPTVRSSMPTTSSGPADDSKKVPCDVCHGRGQVELSLVVGRKRQRTLRICLGCDGTARRPRRKEDPPFDEYVGRLRANGHPRSMTAREYDDELERLRDDAKTRAGRVDHERYGWEKAHEDRDVAGSYVELDRAVAVLRARRPLIRLSSPAAAYELALIMVGQVKVPGAVHEALSEERRQVALELYRKWGWTAGEIGRALGVSRSTVGRWLKSVRAVK